MKGCSEIRPRIVLYVDREVTGAEALDFEAHLMECTECRSAYDDLRQTVDVVRAARPLYEMPEQCYAVVQGMTRRWERRQQRHWWLPSAAAAAVFVALAIASISGARSEYQTFAAQVHRDYARGAFPLDVASSEPQVVSNWLEPRVPFHLRLPDYPEGGPKRYALLGARLMQYRGEDVAYLAYEMDRKPISLLISSSPRITPSGGDRYRSGGLSFYFSAEQGLRIITWKDKGLTYAQVSDLNVKGAESCAICHGTEAERPRFEGLGKRL